MPRLDGLRRLVADVLIPVCIWWADRRVDQSNRWVHRGFKLRAWAKQAEQTRS